MTRFTLWCDNCRTVPVTPADITVVFGPTQLCGHAGARFTCPRCARICFGQIADDVTAATLIGQGADTQHITPPNQCAWVKNTPMTTAEAAGHAADILEATTEQLWTELEGNRTDER